MRSVGSTTTTTRARRAFTMQDADIATPPSLDDGCAAAYLIAFKV